MKIGITGYSGHIGRELLKYPDTLPLVCDVTRPQEVEMAIKSVKPDVVVHLASVSEVDVCEKPANEKWITNVNVGGTANVAGACLDRGIDMVLLSTAQVFSGRGWASYRENDKPNPINSYGWSKWGAEILQNPYPNIKIVRTSYLFDMERLGERIDSLRRGNYQEYPTFIVRSFMYLPHFVNSLYAYLKLDNLQNILHISGTKSVSWYGFMRCMAREFVIPEDWVIARKKDLKDEFAPRPYKAGLNVEFSRRLNLPQYSYEDGIREMAGERV